MNYDSKYHYVIVKLNRLIVKGNNTGCLERLGLCGEDVIQKGTKQLKHWVFIFDFIKLFLIHGGDW